MYHKLGKKCFFSRNNAPEFHPFFFLSAFSKSLSSLSSKLLLIDRSSSISHKVLHATLSISPRSFVSVGTLSTITADHSSHFLPSVEEEEAADAVAADLLDTADAEAAEERNNSLRNIFRIKFGSVGRPSLVLRDVLIWNWFTTAEKE